MHTNLIKVTSPVLLIATAVAIAGCGGSGSSNSSSNSNSGGGTSPTLAATYTQVDRLGRPAVNEVFATVANDRHAINDTDSPTNDKNELANDIQTFMTTTAGRSQAITDVVKAVLVPDLMVADLSQTGVKAAYLGVETGGATGSKFGGRALTDDIVDTSLGIIFGNTVPSLDLAPDDGKEIAALTTDNVGPGGKHFTATFPYLGVPQ
jgi:hypothetical protein